MPESFCTSDKLYFEPLTVEDVLSIYEKEKPDGAGVSSELVLKLQEGRPNIVDAIENRKIQLVFNVPVGRKGKEDDSYIRKAAIKHRIPYITSAEAVVASVEGICADFKMLHGI